MSRARVPLVLLLGLLAFLLPSCGAGNPAAPLAQDVADARNLQAVSSLQQALVALALVRAESGGTYGTNAEDLAALLQAKNPSLGFGNGPSSGPEQVQVQGGGAGPAMLTVSSESGASVGGWTDGAATLYYRGTAPPAFGPSRPTGAGWSETPPT